jgi:O-acetyl-ADP-ribose deacetylase (regulator of RNase III)
MGSVKAWLGGLQSLNLASGRGLRSVAFNSFSGGESVGVISRVRAEIACAAVREWIYENPNTSIREIKFALVGRAVAAYNHRLSSLFG